MIFVTWMIKWHINCYNENKKVLSISYPMFYVILNICASIRGFWDSVYKLLITYTYKSIWINNIVKEFYSLQKFIVYMSYGKINSAAKFWFLFSSNIIYVNLCGANFHLNRTITIQVGRDSFSTARQWRCLYKDIW